MGKFPRRLCCRCHLSLSRSSCTHFQSRFQSHLLERTSSKDAKTSRTMHHHIFQDESTYSGSKKSRTSSWNHDDKNRATGPRHRLSKLYIVQESQNHLRTMLSYCPWEVFLGTQVACNPRTPRISFCRAHKSMMPILKTLVLQEHTNVRRQCASCSRCHTTGHTLPERQNTK